MTFSNNWQVIWSVYHRVIENMKQAVEAIKKLAEVLREAFSNIGKELRKLCNSIEEFKEEYIPTNNCRCPWRYYDYQPQLKVNTKGYAHCHLPVTRRYI